MDKNVEKQLIVRTFEPDMAVLKQVAKQMSGMQDVALNLFGQAGEVLIVITARAHAPAAATELTERIAERFEMALGDSAYGRGKGSVAYFAAGELMQAEALVAASDPKTGGLLGEEFSHTKRGSNVFDFGDSSYQDSRVAAKIKAMAAKNCDATYPPQVAAARAVAAAKCSKAEFGVLVTGLGKAGRDVYMAVAYGNRVYVRRFAQTPDAGKRCALAALDTIRRILQGADTPAMRVFKANSDFDWDAPETARQKGRPAPAGGGKKGSGMLAPIIVLVVLLIALGIAVWYFFTHFTLTSEPSVPAGGSSFSQSVAAGSGSLPASTSQAGSDAGSTSQAPAPGSQSMSLGEDGAYHPFG